MKFLENRCKPNKMPIGNLKTNKSYLRRLETRKTPTKKVEAVAAIMKCN